MLRQHEVRLRSFDPQFPPPVHRIHFVHPREAEADSPLTLDSAIDIALLQPDVIAAGSELPVARHDSTTELRSLVRYQECALPSVSTGQISGTHERQLLSPQVRRLRFWRFGKRVAEAWVVHKGLVG